MNRRTFLRRAAVVPLVAAIPAAAALSMLAPKPEPQAYAAASVDGEIKLTLDLDSFIPADGTWHIMSIESRLMRPPSSRGTTVLNLDYVTALGG